jgi:hypothetical protein
LRRARTLPVGAASGRRHHPHSPRIVGRRRLSLGARERSDSVNTGRPKGPRAFPMRTIRSAVVAGLAMRDAVSTLRLDNAGGATPVGGASRLRDGGSSCWVQTARLYRARAAMPWVARAPLRSPTNGPTPLGRGLDAGRCNEARRAPTEPTPSAFRLDGPRLDLALSSHGEARRRAQQRDSAGDSARGCRVGQSRRAAIGRGRAW